MKYIESKELREVQLGILDYVDDFCSRNKINYWLVGGTLIGAIRHKGFIPWDDDIDICLLRADYDRFVELMEKEDNETYKIYSFHNKSKFPIPYAKVGNSKTLIREHLLLWSDYDLGVNIDVFPFDTIPGDEKKQKQMYRTFHFYRMVLQLKQLHWDNRRNVVKNVGVVALRILLKLMPYSYIVSKMNENALQYRDVDSPLCGNVVWGYGMKEISKKEYFTETQRVAFEGREYPIFKGYDAFLRKIYGDYMQLPPEDKRISHGAEAWWK